MSGRGTEDVPAAADRDRLRRRADFLREREQLRALRRRVAPRRQRVQRVRQLLRAASLRR